MIPIIPILEDKRLSHRERVMLAWLVAMDKTQTAEQMSEALGLGINSTRETLALLIKRNCGLVRTRAFDGAYRYTVQPT